MAKYTGQELGGAVCEALGLAPGSVRRMTLRFGLGEAAMAEVEHFIDTDKHDFKRVIQRYRLVPEGEADEVGDGEG